MEIGEFLPIIKALHERIRGAVIDACERSAIESMAEVAKEEEGDTIYAVDKVSEELIVEFLKKRSPERLRSC